MRTVVLGLAGLMLLISCSAGSARQPSVPDGTYYCGGYAPLDDDAEPTFDPESCARE